MPSAEPSLAPVISVVIPVLDDLGVLERLLTQLETAAALHSIEVIVANAGDTPLKRRPAGGMPVMEVVCEAGRGGQLNRGAAQASGQVLWFLHADAEPPGDAIPIIRQHIEAGHCGGWFRFRFSGPQTGGRRWLASCVNWRANRGVPYGDQGLFFTRDCFEACGGFEEVPLFEEVALVKQARAFGDFAEVDAEIGVDPRRWEQSGWVKRTLKNRALAIAHAWGISPTRLWTWYQRW